MIFIENQRVVIADDLALNVNSSTDWFDVTMEASVRRQPPHRRDEILAALEAKNSVREAERRQPGLFARRVARSLRDPAWAGREKRDQTAHSDSTSRKDCS